MQPLPIAHEPLLYVSSPSLSPVQVGFKRAFDIAVAAALLVALAPLLAAIAIAIKLTDHGPVLFRQKRVGRNGVEFEILKFRSMCVDAEARLAALRAGQNERSGPLFKLTVDPRVTKVGRLIRAFSFDELPQLLNVLRGDMSLVGPRPALPSEVAEFPDELQARHLVRPGITGLWQVEARDNPSFEAYRRLDLFYVDNWSLLLDLIILLGTIDHVLVRPFMNRTAQPSPAGRRRASTPGRQRAPSASRSARAEFGAARTRPRRRAGPHDWREPAPVSMRRSRACVAAVPRSTGGAGADRAPE